MNIFLLLYGQLDQKSSLAKSTPILDCIKEFIKLGTLKSDDLILIYVTSSFVDNEKAFKTIEKTILKLLSNNKLETVKVNVIYNNEINVYNFDQINNIINSFVYTLTHIQNNPLKDKETKIYLIPSSRINTLDLALFLLPNYFEEDIDFVTYKLNYELKIGPSDNKIDVNKAFKNKEFIDSIFNKVDKKDNKYRQVEFRFDYNLEKYNIYEKMLNTFSYKSLKNILGDSLIPNSKLDNLIDFAINIEKGNSDYVDLKKSEFDFFPCYKRQEDKLASEIYNNLLVMTLKCYMHIIRNEIRTFVSKIEALYKDSMLLALYTYVENSKFMKFLEFPNSGNKVEKLFYDKVYLNRAKINNNLELKNKILKYSFKYEQDRKSYLDSVTLIGFMEYFVPDKPNLLRLLTNTYLKAYKAENSNASLINLLNSSTHNIQFEYKEEYLELGKVLLKSILAILYLLADHKDLFDIENFHIENDTKPKVLTMLNQNILLELSKIIKK